MDRIQCPPHEVDKIYCDTGSSEYTHAQPACNYSRTSMSTVQSMLLLNFHQCSIKLSLIKLIIVPIIKVTIIVIATFMFIIVMAIIIHLPNFLGHFLCSQCQFLNFVSQLLIFTC